MGAPQSDRLAMSLQSLSLSQRNDGWRDLPQAGAREFLHGNHLEEIEDTQASAEASRTSSGQHVIRPRPIVTRRLRRIISEENRACADNLREILSCDSDMFRCYPVRPFNRLL